MLPCHRKARRSLPIPSSARQRILFLAEDVTTDQLTRLFTLARALPDERFEVTFAAARFGEPCFAGTGIVQRRIDSLPREQILRSVAEGKQVYDAQVLKKYLADDIRLLRAVRPHLVVANFRPSLTVSAPLHGVPVATVVSAHWSPFAVRNEFPVPDHPTVNTVGVDLARRLLPKALPAAFSIFARPINALRRQHGLPAIGPLPDVMAWGDMTLYPDVPDLAPTRGTPSTHHYLGHVRYSAPVTLPSWWDELPRDRPTVYLTLGSSGNLAAWPALAQGLGELPVNVMLATAGRIDTAHLPANFRVADLLPGDQAARRASVVVTNGGSGSSYQALAESRPVIGVASNLDQHLAMQAIERAGAGQLHRAGQLTVARVQAAVTEALSSGAQAEAAGRLAQSLNAWDATARFVALVDRATRRGATRIPA